MDGRPARPPRIRLPGSSSPPAGLALRGRAFQHGLCRFLYLPDPALRPVAGARRCGNRHPGRGAVGPGARSVHPYRRVDGPVRRPRRHTVLRLDGMALSPLLLDSAFAGMPIWFNATERSPSCGTPASPVRRSGASRRGSVRGSCRRSRSGTAGAARRHRATRRPARAPAPASRRASRWRARI